MRYFVAGKLWHLPYWVCEIPCCWRSCRFGVTGKSRATAKYEREAYLRCRRSELTTTETELSAMAIEATMGFNFPKAAMGMARVL